MNRAPEARMIDNLPAIPRGLAAGGAVMLSAIAMGGNAVAASNTDPGTDAATTAAEVFNGHNSLVETNFGATAAQAGDPRCNHAAGLATCSWVVTKVENEPGSHQHPWVNCVGLTRSRLLQHLTCSIGKSKSNSVTADIGGSFPAGLAAISARVGYNVTQTTTLTASDTVDVPTKTSVTVQWGAVYSNFKKVTQQYEECYEKTPGLYSDCQPNAHPNSNHLRYAYTEQFDHPDFRVVTTK